MVAFLIFDSLTVQWQDTIYDTYGRRNVDPFQMMMGVSFFGVVLSSLSLIISEDIGTVIEFCEPNPAAIWMLVMPGVDSSLGQLFVYFTIREFGPVAFTIIMTIQQVLSIVLSAIAFQ